MDPIGFGLKYRTKKLHNKLMDYEEWLALYPHASINISVRVQLESTGLLG
ncbi:Ger(x)C family spore germination C-terminal domain-containing protein [Lysinibacillus antri]